MHEKTDYKAEHDSEKEGAENKYFALKLFLLVGVLFVYVVMMLAIRL